MIVCSSVSNAQPITGIQAGAASQISIGSVITSADSERYSGIPPVSLTAQSNDGAGGQAIASVVGVSNTGDHAAGIGADIAILSPSIFPIEQSQASAYLNFFFYVTGPTATVLSDIHGAIGIHVGDPRFNFALAYITIGELVGTSGIPLLALACQSGSGFSFGSCTFPNNSGTFDLPVDLPVNATLYVQMLALAAGYDDVQIAVDPVFTIDPSVPNADQYAFVFPDGISNGDSAQQNIPEPGSLAFYGLGIGALAMMGTRRKR